MSIFSRMKKSRQQAKDHNAKLAEQQQKEQDKPPYRHIPTHAATDAIASAPPSWREGDRQRIQEENRRRSALAASGHHMNMPGVPRVGSSLSHVSYPSDVNVNPMVRLPRAYSYNGVSPYPTNYNRNNVYSLPDVTPHYTTSSKGKEAVSRPSYETPRISPTPSKGESVSSGGSSSSQDDLEMKSTRLPVKRPAAPETSLRLHPHRRISDSSIDRVAMVNSANSAPYINATRDARPPPSMRGFAAIAPVVNAPISAPMSRTRSSSPGDVLNTQHHFETSLPSHMVTATASDFADISKDTTSTSQSGGALSLYPPVKSFKERRLPKSTRFTDLERIESNTEAPVESPDTPDHMARTAVATKSVPEPVILNAFPEEDSVPAPEMAKKSKRFSKSGGRLMKKNRWANSKATAVAV